MKRILVLGLVLVLAIGSVYGADKVKVRWFVGLGAGSDEPVIPAQKKVVADFNKSQDKIELVLEIVSNNQATNTLATEIAAGNAPDIVGPVGVQGRDGFKGAWADLDPLVKKFKYDLTQFDAEMVKFYRDPKDGLIGLPFAIYPSFIYVNKELFKEAGLPLPPQKYGAPYIDEKGNKKVWDMNTLREISMKLTVDANGNDATSPKFDPTKIVQFGFGEQFADLRAGVTGFGAGNFFNGKDTKNAVIPAAWVEGWKWLHKAMWVDHFVPNASYGNSDQLGKGNWFESQKVAMVHTHLWYAGYANLKFDWDTAAMPSYKGKVTAKMHADTFEITKYSKNKDAAFTALTYLLGPGSSELLQVYGGMPARKALQPEFLASFAKAKFPGKKINWQVVSDSAKYADTPNHQAWMPSYQESSTRLSQLWDKLNNEAVVDVDAEAAKLKADLTKIFQAAKN